MISGHGETPVTRIVLTAAYDGTDFRGWAANPESRTVQGTLTEAVRLIANEENEMIGASRTDSGAHARGQVVAFNTTRPIAPEHWANVLNRRLPLDLRIVRSRQAPEGFSPRFAARDRWYRYRIHQGRVDPFRARYVHEHGKPLDLELMRLAAERMVGTHDFRAFTEELEPTVENTVRTLYSIEVRQVRDEMWVDVVGTAFLRGMMRKTAGVLLEVGRGYRPVEEVSRLLDIEERNSLRWPVVLPARGLCLMRVRYGRHPRDHRTAL
ncbi:tRNA pseudouridine(38-40) synthase TruA [bacterium]|nr:MAG: tRNA pseudouridine(38-40) synthase TruA [bacterium]